MRSLLEQADEARVVRRLADRIARLAARIETTATDDERHAWWSEIHANAAVIQMRVEYARQGN